MENDTVNISVRNGDKPNTRKVTVEFTIASDIEKMKAADLGTSHQTCKICGGSGEFQTWKLIEMQYGTGHEFRYFECPRCETLQIEKFPENISDYYSNEYYSYVLPEIKMRDTSKPANPLRVLDVGCGAGAWLCRMAAANFVFLYGCDPFINNDIKYANGVQLFKRSIHEMDGKYDLIQFNDSLEHMSDPHEVFKTLDRLLKNKKRAHVGGAEPEVKIILPVYPSLSVDIFGMYSFALDAPRHYFLYSEKALSMLAEQYGFYIADRVNRPIWGHLGISRAYQRGIKWTEFWPKFQGGELWNEPKKQEAIFEALMRCASVADYVDHAAFTLKRCEE